MGGNRNKGKIPSYNTSKVQAHSEPKVTSLLDAMKDGQEYESIVGLNNLQIDLGSEIRRAIEEISKIRKKPILCYVSNVINNKIKTSVSIDLSDDQPFLEMLDSIPCDDKELDIVLVTPGGSAEIVANFVNRVRQRFSKVSFILPYMAMSAGTIFCLSGDELIMSSNSFIGPIDPQVPSKDGRYVPAQSVTTLINDIQRRGQEQLIAGKQPNWTDVQILRNLDPKEIGNSINASQFSIDLVSEYLAKYKFSSWNTHSNGATVTQEQKKSRANEIAATLCNHSLWLSHARRISREMVSEQCKLQVIHTEEIENLDRAVKRFWALMSFSLENTDIVKIFASNTYALFRSEQHIDN